jgi:hypothetical protein
MQKHYFLLDNVRDWPHSGLVVQKGQNTKTEHTIPVDNLLSHFSEFSYTNFYNSNKDYMLEPHAYKFILNFIHMPQSTEFSITQQSVQMLRENPKAYLILMSCHEYVITPEQLAKTLERYKIPVNKTIVLCSNLEAHGKFINGVYYICINFWESFSKYHHKFLPNVPVANINKKIKQIKSANKKFICLNRNVKPHRIWFYYALIKQNMLDQGHVSYHLPKIQPNDYKTFTTSHHVLKRIPAALHEDFKITNMRKMYPRMLDKLNTEAVINYGSSIEEYYQDSLLSFVTESDSTKNFITEKTYKAIANLHPFFIIGNPAQHALLRNRGYHTFEHLFGSDGVMDYEQATAMLQHVNSYEMSVLKRTLERNYFDKLVHNYQNFFNRNITWKSIVEEIFNAIEKK